MSLTEVQANELRSQLSKALQEKESIQAQYTESEMERRSLKATVNDHSTQDRETRELKAALADCRFQLKKLDEDVATERTMNELERIKFIKNYEQKITDLKSQIDRDNQTWIKRFDIRDQEYKDQVEVMRKKLQDQSQEQIRSFKVKTDSKFENILKEHETQTIRLKETMSKIQKTHKEQKEHIFKEAEEKLGQQLKAAHDRVDFEITRKEKQFSLKVSLIENERKNEEKQHQHTKTQFVSTKDSLYQQIYKLSNQKDQLQVQVTDLRVETEEKAKKIIALNNSIKELEVKHDGQIKSLVENSKRNLQSLKSQSHGNIEDMLRNQLVYIETMEHKVIALQGKQSQLALDYQGQIEQIKLCYQQRPSKSQDTDIIKNLKESLWRIQKDLDYAQEEIKWFKLQLDNKQQVYSKFFAGGYRINQLKAATTETNIPKSPNGRNFKTRRLTRSVMNSPSSRNGEEFNKTQAPSEFGSVLEVPKNIQ